MRVSFESRYGILDSPLLSAETTLRNAESDLLISLLSFMRSELGALPERLLDSDPARSTIEMRPSTMRPFSSVLTMMVRTACEREDVSLSLVDPVERRADATLPGEEGQRLFRLGAERSHSPEVLVKLGVVRDDRL